MNKIACIVFFFTLLTQSLHSQELNCSVQINSSQVQTSDKSVFENLQSSIYEFMNNRKWTNYDFKIEEKIECSIMITITSYDNVDAFTGSFQIQARRPVFNSSYFSTLLNHQDKDISFKYLVGQPIDFVENTYVSNLSSLLSFYAYLIIGLDFDSFEEFGGSPFYDKAQSIINTVPGNSTDKGWKAYESQKNRYWILENLTNKAFSEFRKGIYTYHLKGMDSFTEDPVKARNSINEAMLQIQNAYKEKPGLYIISIFMNTKSDELVNIFTPAPLIEKTKIVNTLKAIDPVNSAKYNKMLTDKL